MLGYPVIGFAFGLIMSYLVQLVVSARHIAYGLSMIKRMPFSGRGFISLPFIWRLTDFLIFEICGN